jgi:hypothetical protein
MGVAGQLPMKCHAPIRSLALSGGRTACALAIIVTTGAAAAPLADDGPRLVPARYLPAGPAAAQVSVDGADWPTSGPATAASMGIASFTVDGGGAVHTDGPVPAWSSSAGTVLLPDGAGGSLTLAEAAVRFRDDDHHFIRFSLKARRTGAAPSGRNWQMLSLESGAATQVAASIVVPSACPADITGPDGTGDGNVDALDVLLLISEWGSSCAAGCAADITGPAALVPDGVVDSLDLLVLISQWGSPGNCP